MPLPHVIKPMLAKSGGRPFDDEDFGFEIKWDGLRGLAIANGEFRLQSRHLTTITNQFPELEFGRLPDGTVIDGEVVVFKNDAPSFHALQKRAHLCSAAKIELAARTTPATFMAFDLPYERGERITTVALSERRQRLARLIRQCPHERLLLTDQIVGRGIAYYQAVEERGLEGVIAKRLDSGYVEGKRSAAWAKIVAWRLEALRVLGYVKERGESRVKSIAVGRRSHGHWLYLGQVGDLPDDEKTLLYDTLKDASPLTTEPRHGPASVVWRDINLHCYIRYFEESSTGRLRLARFKGWAKTSAPLSTA